MQTDKKLLNYMLSDEKLSRALLQVIKNMKSERVYDMKIY